MATTEDLAADYDAMLAYYDQRMKMAGLRVETAADYSDRYEAMNDLARARADRDAFNKMAHEHAASINPQPRPSPYPVADDGTVLTPAVAMKAAGLDPNNQADCQAYARGAQKLALAKANGMYQEGKG